jgi:mono/diheme cytochrome c family protein
MKALLSAAAALLLVTAAPQTAAAQDRDGKTFYGELCKKCHGVLGTPPQTMKKKYEKIVTFDTKFLEKHSEDSIVVILTKGKGEDMESVKDKLSPAEMKLVAKYVRELAAKPKPGGQH